MTRTRRRRRFGLTTAAVAAVAVVAVVMLTSHVAVLRDSAASLEHQPPRFASPELLPTCGAGLFVVHWTHVPKAGGTAFAEIAKRVACAKNKELFKGVVNPCCLKRLCLKDGRCDTTYAGGCPLVQNVGLHSFNAARVHDVPCEGCGRRWFDVTASKGLLAHVFRRPPTPEVREEELRFLKQRQKKKKNVTLPSMDFEVASHTLWPIPQRAAFFARAGIPLRDVEAHLKEPKFQKAAGDLVGAARRAAHSAVADTCLPATPNVSLPPADVERRRRLLGSQQCEGTASMTVIRHPFTRAASAFFYRGHSPNYDVFDLRPGLWLPPHVQRANVTLREYLGLPEYRNVLTKLFGDDTACNAAKARGCRHRKTHGFQTCRCAVFGGCFAYRNASLSETHLTAAMAILEKHAFVGLQEAPISSALLAARIFGLDDSEVQVNATRLSATMLTKCSPAKVVRHDPDACREAMLQNNFDVLVYEHVHRRFCDDLRLHDLRNLPDVIAELHRNRLCRQDVVFSNPDHVCGVLETNASFTYLDDLRTKCKRATGPEWWLHRFGFHANLTTHRRR